MAKRKFPELNSISWFDAISDKGRIKLPKPKELRMSELSYLMNYFKQLNKTINGNH